MSASRSDHLRKVAEKLCASASHQCLAGNSAGERKPHTTLREVICPKGYSRSDWVGSKTAAEVFIGVQAKVLANGRWSGAYAGIPYVKLPGRNGRVKYQVGDLLDFMAQRVRSSTSDKGGDQ